MFIFYFYISTSSKEQIISETKSWNDYVKSVIIFTYPVIFRTIFVQFVTTLVQLSTNILIFRNKYVSVNTFEVIINRPGVAGAVIETPSSIIYSLSQSLILFLQTF